MAITDIQISEELETNAPSIKYKGDEGPKSPQEMEQMADALLKEEYEKYIYDLLEQRPDATPMSFEEFRRMVMSEGQMSKGPILPSPEDPVNPFGPKPQGPVLPDRQMAAYGGIMGMDGRRQYGIGSFFQKAKDKFVDDIIPNEIKENPLAAAAALGIGSNYFDIIPGERSSKGYLGELFNRAKNKIMPGTSEVFSEEELEKGVTNKGKTIPSSVYGSNPSFLKRASDFVLDLDPNILATIGGGVAGLFTNNQPATGLPSDKTGIELANLKQTANVLDQKQGMAAGLNFLPSVASRKYSPAEMAMTYAQAANGGRIGFNNGGDTMVMKMREELKGKGYDWLDAADDQTVRQIFNSEMGTFTDSSVYRANGGRINRAEGGIMDLGGMEKDYRAEGGFVPIGKEEKADDVPARLSVNEFVFTADAVRNAGGGDIDQGAKVMENMMKHLEAGGQVSEESQGMQGARDMFEVSERLSEVV